MGPGLSSMRVPALIPEVPFVRRNTVLALATVVAMAVIAALLVWNPFSDGDALPGVSVSDGDTPKVSVSEPVEADDPKVEVVSEGDGDTIEEGDYFRADYIIANGEDGEQQDSSYGTDEQGAPAASIVFQFIDVDEAASPQTAPGLPQSMLDALEGTKVGSKVLVAIQAVDFFGAELFDQAEAAGQTEQLPYTRDQVLIFYFDVQDAVDVSADPAPKGAEEDLPAGIPTPVVDGDDVTGLDGSGATGPATEAASVVIKGDGREVAAEDFVFANYVGQIYPSGAVFDSSFERGEPSLFPLTNVIACWTNQLTGQTVGSRVVLTCPSDTAYGDQGGAGGTIAPGDSLTFVVDIVDAL